MTTGTFSDYARHAGITPQRVHQLSKAGRLVMVEDGGPRPVVDFEATNQRLEETGSLAQPGTPGRPRDEQAERIGAVFRQSQAQHKAFTAKRAQLDYERAAGLLVERAAVDAAVFEAFRQLRDLIMAVPRRCAPDVVGLADMRAIETTIADELRAAFDRFERRAPEQIAEKLTK